jgi:hypothetical protein
MFPETQSNWRVMLARTKRRSRRHGSSNPIPAARSWLISSRLAHAARNLHRHRRIIRAARRIRPITLSPTKARRLRAQSHLNNKRGTGENRSVGKSCLWQISRFVNGRVCRRFRLQPELGPFQAKQFFFRTKATTVTRKGSVCSQYSVARNNDG